MESKLSWQAVLLQNLWCASVAQLLHGKLQMDCAASAIRAGGLGEQQEECILSGRRRMENGEGKPSLPLFTEVWRALWQPSTKSTPDSIHAR